MNKARICFRIIGAMVGAASGVSAALVPLWVGGPLDEERSEGFTSLLAIGAMAGLGTGAWLGDCVYRKRQPRPASQQEAPLLLNMTHGELNLTDGVGPETRGTQLSYVSSHSQAKDATSPVPTGGRSDSVDLTL